jgi:hypothetical protein
MLLDGMTSFDGMKHMRDPGVRAVGGGACGG